MAATQGSHSSPPVAGGARDRSFELRDKTILLISGEPWHGLRMSKHHLASELVRRGNHVLWLDPPAPGNKGLYIQRTDGIGLITYRHWLRGVNRMPKRIRDLYYRRLLSRIEQREGRRIDIIWCFDTSRVGRFPRDGRFGLLHLADLRVLHGAEDLVRTADLILTTAAPSAKAALAMAPAAAVVDIGHAIDGQWAIAAPRKAGGRSRPVAVYAGNLAMPMIDWEQLDAEVAAHPEVDFRFVGPCPPTGERAFLGLKGRSNVHFTGLLTGSDLVHAVADADVMLMCYRADLYPDDLANPHKMLEYLATGNCIVASYTAAYEGSHVPLLMARERWEHAALLGKALSELDLQNSPALRAQRTAFALEHSMVGLMDRTEKLIASAWR